MKLTICGAAGTVTGSCHLLELDSGYRVLLDCGLYQGREEDFVSFNEEWIFDPDSIDCLVLSHAHIDHSGRIPKLVKDGFSGDIICTDATRDLCAIMLMDSAYIQEQDAKYEAKKGSGGPIEPLYSVEDAENAIEQFVGISYERWYQISNEVSVLFRDAGHILGSATVTLKIKRNESEFLLGFTGDVGRPDRPILRDPIPMPDVDFLICESTYGGEKHDQLPDDEKRFLSIIRETCVDRKGKLLIPAFSVGRTQEIVYMLDRLETAGKLPKVPVFVDSPLAVNATDIFIAHPECYDRELREYMREDPNPFGFGHLHYVRSVEKSKSINFLNGPAIIISASGMMSGGRIRHHIFNHIEEESATLLIVGFCAPGTLGAVIRTKPESIKLFGQERRIKARIEIMDSFSGHADQDELLEFLKHMNRDRLKRILLVHGERDRQIPLKAALEATGFKSVILPELGESFTI
ncbi:MBL fold metallo-hydrolase RNA specificity domain-containing protein [Fulvivirga sedimenti]|uniref:MBL fold metallo-hydrolase n=1 Tax=Fulvivirga sedimenti TaxID=2879465 RepID=A0A9X1HKK8_9BACT|nr:MBL fold metallo-hydrolase [Fulvivirga sedimenti]MCA6073974.1 MBL fold metallo-hydrolase [Fulvivirga sedimenti]